MNFLIFISNVLRMNQSPGGHAKQLNRIQSSCEPSARTREVEVHPTSFQIHKRKSGGTWNPRRPSGAKVQFTLQVTFGATSSALTVVLITGRSTPSTGSTTPK
jgi:hypothetical protein